MPKVQEKTAEAKAAAKVDPKAKGDQNVRHLQERLRHLGYPVEVTGTRDAKTEHSVRLFQNDHGLKGDGDVGDLTKTALRGSSRETIEALRNRAQEKAAGKFVRGTRESTSGSSKAEDAASAGESLTPSREVTSSAREQGDAAAGGEPAASSPSRRRITVTSGDHRIVIHEAWSPQARAAAATARKLHGTGFAGREDAKAARGALPADGHTGRLTDAHMAALANVGEQDLPRGFDRATSPGEDHKVHILRGGKRIGTVDKQSGRVLREAESTADMPSTCGMDHGKLARKGLPRCPKCKKGLKDLTEAFRAIDRMSPATLRLEEHVGMRELAAAGLLEPVAEAKDSLAKASTPEPFSTSKTSNWVARVGGLPDYVQHVAHDLVEKRGMPESRAIQMAIGIVKRWARGGGNVDKNTRAAAAKAVAEWEAKKAKSHAQSVAKHAAKA